MQIARILYGVKARADLARKVCKISKLQTVQFPNQRGRHK